MFPEGEKFIKGINEVVNIFPEESRSEFFRSTENIPKRENSGAGIDK